ncbi:hypothetical protein RN001_002798 [Aquatica leii]|uniref:Uncharacterized protein n=1 Tax=Aquatica leii TaxID=1421715 RepID=A0AAN7PHD6_9COLE|nr:hypothetical protein RN001_002798 [Aquatica leii]
MTNILSAQNKVASFVRKLELYQRRIKVGDMSMFTQLCEQLKHDKADKITFENFVFHHLSSVIKLMQQYFPDMDNRQSNSWIFRPFY